MEGVIVKEAFESRKGGHIEAGEFWLDEVVEDQEGQEIRVYKKAGYDQTIKLTNSDLKRWEVQEVEMGPRR